MTAYILGDYYAEFRPWAGVSIGYNLKKALQSFDNQQL